MQWTVPRKFFIVVFGIQFCFSQTYIVKFKSAVKDSAEIYSRILPHLSKSNTPTTVSQSVSVKSFPAASYSRFPWPQYAVIRFSGQVDQQLVQSLSENSDIEYIQQSYNYKIYSMPNDSAYSSQWNLRRIGISTLWEKGVLNSTLPTVKLGLVDTGIDFDHPDLTHVVAINSGETGLDNFGNDKRTNGIDDDGNGFIDDWRGYDFVDSQTEDAGDWNIRDNDPTDENGHGTSVAGIIGAETNNGIGLSGIAPCTILPLRCFGKNGTGSDIDIASAIVYAADNGAEVINMSFGDVIASPLLHDAIRYAYEHNIVLVASSGNDGSAQPHYPSDFSEVISVGSVNRFDTRSFFSSHSPSLDLMAPGEQIVTTTLHGGYTDNFSGTSAAAPHVAGVAAIIKSIEEQKKNLKNTYVPLSNEEIRGVLLNSADDAGSKGWDEFYASGILNAENALQTVSGSTVLIHSPKLDEILTTNITEIIVTAATPYLKSVSLFYGRGEMPTQWQLISTIENKILINDTIRFLDKILLPDDTYILRLVVSNSRGNNIEFRQRIFLQRNAPKVLSLQFHNLVLVGGDYGALIEARLDRNCFGKLYYKRTTDQNFSRLQSLGVQKNHFFVLTAKDLQPDVQYQMYLEFVEASAEQRSTTFFLTDSLEGLFSVTSSTIPSTGFEKKSYSLPAGYLLNAVQQYNSQPTVIVNQYTQDGDFHLLKAFSFTQNSFAQKDSSNRVWIPRSYTKEFILVQDRGVSQLLKTDTTTATFFQQAVWGDSSDVWASQFVDLDEDGLPEIIARSSTEYLIYKNNGQNNFSLATTLPNPSPPFMNDTRNQFGPPRSVVGDFTNSGRKEILFADYDGDVLMYRQTNTGSLHFTLVGIDSTDLFEMSDYITAGDFNGDGILDFAVAGHSNLDLNGDREYDAPVWTVRVFSHRSTDPIGSISKIWEQHFVGVKSGSKYDNGVLSGKLKNTDRSDALILSLNPFLYVFTWNNTRQTFEPVWIHSSQSNSAIVYDFDNDGMNDIGFHTNGKIEFWSLENSLSSVQAPWSLTAKSLSASTVQLLWNSSYTVHNIYRGIMPDALSLVATTNGTQWIDTTVAQHTTYYYTVTAVSTSESPHGTIVSITPHSAPTITNVRQISQSQLTITLSFNISSENLLGALFVLEDTLSSSSVVWVSNKNLLVTFPLSIPNGNRKIKIKKLIDASGMEGDTTQSFTFLARHQEAHEFFARSATLESATSIRIDFSEQPEGTQSLQTANYSVKNIAKNFTIVRVDSISPLSVRLRFSQHTNLSEVALRLEVRLSENIRSQAGVPLMNGKGQTLSIAQETDNIAHIVVYPNPVKGEQIVSFVNLPSNCRITVYSVSGERIKIFDRLSTSEGVTWNLRDEKGETVSTGIYLYRLEKIDESGAVTATTLGKFAVIR